MNGLGVFWMFLTLSISLVWNNLCCNNCSIVSIPMRLRSMHSHKLFSLTTNLNEFDSLQEMSPSVQQDKKFTKMALFLRLRLFWNRNSPDFDVLVVLVLFYQWPKGVEVGFRPLILPRAILKVAKLPYFHFITLIIFIYYYMHYIMIMYTS